MRGALLTLMMKMNCDVIVSLWSNEVTSTKYRLEWRIWRWRSFRSWWRKKRCIEIHYYKLYNILRQCLAGRSLNNGRGTKNMVKIFAGTHGPCFSKNLFMFTSWYWVLLCRLIVQLIKLKMLLHKPSGSSLGKGTQPEDKKFVQRKFWTGYIFSSRTAIFLLRTFPKHKHISCYTIAIPIACYTNIACYTHITC